MIAAFVQPRPRTAALVAPRCRQAALSAFLWQQGAGRSRLRHRALSAFWPWPSSAYLPSRSIPRILAAPHLRLWIPFGLPARSPRRSAPAARVTPLSRRCHAAGHPGGHRVRLFDRSPWRPSWRTSGGPGPGSSRRRGWPWAGGVSRQDGGLRVTFGPRASWGVLGALGGMG